MRDRLVVFVVVFLACLVATDGAVDGGCQKPLNTLQYLGPTKDWLVTKLTQDPKGRSTPTIRWYTRPTHSTVPFPGNLITYAQVNCMLKYPRSFGSSAYKWFGPLIRNLRAELSTLDDYKFPQPGVGHLFRGSGLAQTPKAGDFLMAKGFISSSKSKRVAQQFAGQGTDNWLIYFKGFKAGKAKDVEPLSDLPQEKEVLLLPGQCWKVTAVMTRQQKIKMAQDDGLKALDPQNTNGGEVHATSVNCPGRLSRATVLLL